jgi:CheY-like chemotaxis protein
MGTPLHILIIEDNADDALLLVRALEHGGYEVTWQRVDRRDQMQRALAQQPVDIVFSDHAMPTFSAPGALRLLREGGYDIPIIIVSGIASKQAPALLMEFGANDYVLKSELDRLVPIVRQQLQAAAERRKKREGK